MVESRALLKLRTPKGYRGFESLPHRHCNPVETFSQGTVPIRFVHLRILLLLLLDRGKTFLLLVPRPRGLRRLTTNEERDRSEQANDLKLFDI